jgi:hypothetical protein
MFQAGCMLEADLFGITTVASTFVANGREILSISSFLSLQAYCIETLGFQEAVWNEQTEKGMDFQYI